jgi:predicted phosphodiesterase
MKIAALSDIHGNIWALEAVLDDIRGRQVDAIVNLGNSVFGPLDPSAAAARLRDSRILSIRGNKDRLLRSVRSNDRDNPTLAFTRGCMDSEDRRWLRSLPATETVGRDVFLCHGTLESDELYLLERVTPSGVQIRPPSVLAEYVGTSDRSLFLCGHSHMPRVVALPNNRMIVNVGSVGVQAYWDDWPFPHVMENGSPQARYALISGWNGIYEAEIVAVDYDWAAAAAAAETHGRPDWAAWLRTGLAAENK